MALDIRRGAFSLTPSAFPEKIPFRDSFFFLQVTRFVIFFSLHGLVN